MNRKIKIGIDVGGTFTHAVAIDISDYTIVGKSCVPTTHRASEGVARGVVDSMLILIKECGINADEIILIAHSTTQATNALLEGDVAKVGIVGLGKGVEGKIAKKQLRSDDIELAPGKNLPTFFAYIDTSLSVWHAQVSSVIAGLVKQGAEVIVASEVFGVDSSVNEEFVVAKATELGYTCTAASSISKLYGLKVRTRTAVINASMMPKMLETANKTEEAIRNSGIKAPLMVMRSDGGIMDINEMRKRPILTMLSGPAAGVAAALKYIKISDGVFLEVGGTSTDISIIKNGKPQLKTAQIGKNRLFLRTLDVRTLGIAGGSVPRMRNKEIIDVGPRSAHIANLKYIAYSGDVEVTLPEIEFIQPIAGDPADYMAVKVDSEQQRYAITPTEASYYLGLVHSFGHGQGNVSKITAIFEHLFGTNAKYNAERILTLGAEKIKPVIEQLMREYKLDRDLLSFVGGGGGASAIVPFTATYMGAPHTISENCEVISAIGAALGIIRDSVERNIINPSDKDILELRKEAISSVCAMGANPETVEVTIEIDTRNKKVIATAMGSGEMKTEDLNIPRATESSVLEIIAASIKLPTEKVSVFGKTEGLIVGIGEKETGGLFGFFKRTTKVIRVADYYGTIRLQLNEAHCRIAEKSAAKEAISSLIQSLTSYGDAGALLPDVYIIQGSRIIDLSGLIMETQIQSLMEIELKNVIVSEEIILLAIGKK